MSMISAQIDELRLMARLVREYEYKEISRMLRKAADTILVMDERLRDAERHHRIDMDVIGLMYHPEIVEQLEAENAKLRTQLADVTESMGRVEERCAKLRELISEPTKCDSCEAMLDCDECLRADVTHKERKRLKYENDRLRNLVARVWVVARLLHANKHITDMRITDEFRAECEEEFSELGIEVDG